MISGTTRLIAHLGYPTETFKAPLIYNPYFEKHLIDAVVVPFGVKADDYVDVFKVTTVGLLDEVSTTVKIAGSCNAVLLLTKSGHPTKPRWVRSLSGERPTRQFPSRVSIEH